VYVKTGVDVVVEIVRLKLTVCPDVRVTLEGIADRVGPLVTVGLTLSPRLTVPANPSTLCTLITETPSTPGLTQRFDGLVLRAKSGD